MDRTPDKSQRKINSADYQAIARPTTMNTMEIGQAKKSNTAGAGGPLTLEDFEVVEKLGKGSFGSVYLVKKKDDPAGTPYAMKILEKDKVLA